MAGETKIDLEALRTRMQEGVDRSLKAAGAPVNIQPDAPVSSATENKSPSRGGANGRELFPGEIVRLESAGAAFLDRTGRAIEAAKGRDELMGLVKVVQSRSQQKQKLSFSMGRGIPRLLSHGGDFSEKYDALFETWQTRVVAAIFGHPEYGENYFRKQLIERKKGGQTLSKENFFKEYLEQIGFPQLILSPRVVEKMEGLWSEQKQGGKDKRTVPAEKKKASLEETFSQLVENWRKRGVPFEIAHENGRKMRITMVADDRIEYDYQESGSDEIQKCHITPKEIDTFLAGFKEHFGLAPTGLRLEVSPQEPKRGKNYPVSVAPGSARRPDGEPNDSEKKYNDLFDKLGDTRVRRNFERGNLISAVSVGFQRIFNAYPQDDTKAMEVIGENSDAIVSSFSGGVRVLLKRFGWTPEDEEWFAKEFIQKEIQKIIKS